jgi:hypothetical protein
MSYRIVYPVAMPIDAKDFGEAVKKFIKLNHFMNIEQLILTDQYNHMKANISYYKKHNHRKASIQLFPMDTAAVAAFPGVIGFPGMVSGFSSTNPKAPYPAFAVGPSMLGGPAGIISQAGPLMMEGPAMIGGPVIGGPRIGAMMGGPMMMGRPMMGGPMMGGPMMSGPMMMGRPMMGGPGVAGVIYGATPSASSPSEEIIRINGDNDPMIAITKDGSTFPIIKIEKISDTECKVFGPSGRTSIIKTKVDEDENDIIFENKKYKSDDDEYDIGLIEIIKKTAAATLTPTPTSTSMTFGPTAIITPNKQIIQVGRVAPIGSNVVAVGTDGRPVTGVPVPFGRGIVTSASPLSRIIGVHGGPGVVVGSPMMGSPVRFGRGVY